MRYSLLRVFLPFSLSLSLLLAFSAYSQNLLNPSRTSQDFWSQAQRLVQDQLYLITRIERAIAGPDYNRVEAVRGQLILHSGAVERFLRSQYRVPNLLCSNSTSSPDPQVIADLSLPQREVYCALHASTQTLKPVVVQLEWRLPMLAGLAAPESLPRLNEPLLTSPLNFRDPVKPRYSPVPNFPPPQPPVIGNPTKRAVAAGEPPLQPAIAPPLQTTAILRTARERLLAVLPAFPEPTRIIDPAPNEEIINRATYDISPVEPKIYSKFLAQPNTGIARVLTAQSYRPDPNQLRNRLKPTVLERFPFAPLGKSPSGLTSRLTLQIEEAQFQIPLSGLDYGFMVNVGDVSLEKLNPTLQNLRTLSSEQRQFFLNYLPPNRLQLLQEDRLRFLTGKNGESLVPPMSLPPSTQAPLVLNNTYLLRLVQFQLPEALLNNQPISRGQRRYLDQILRTPSSDVLVAFRPVRQRSDGSYTVIWRVLKQFPDPKITDLENYIVLE
jgi:hypothetical protein